MKKMLLALTVLFLTTTNSFAQLIKLDGAEGIKKSKLVLGLSNDDEANEYFKKAIKEFWTISEVGEGMPVSQALEKAKKDESIRVLKLSKIRVRSLSHTTADGFMKYRYVTSGWSLDIYGSSKKPIVRWYIPAFGEEEYITESIAYFGVSTMNYRLKSVLDNKLKSDMKFKSVYKKRTAELKDKTLLIPREWLSKKMTVEQVEKLYSAKVKVVDFKEWNEAVVTRKAGVAYCMIVPVPMGNGYVYRHHLVDAQSGIDLAICMPKAAVGIGMGPAGVANVSKSNTGYVNDKNLKMYTAALSGKW